MIFKKPLNPLEKARKQSNNTLSMLKKVLTDLSEINTNIVRSVEENNTVINNLTEENNQLTILQKDNEAIQKNFEKLLNINN